MFRTITVLMLINLMITFTVNANLRNFEGNINFVRETVFDTTFISIMVKGDLVRIDERNSQKRITSSQLIVLSEEKVIALSHDQKIYAQVPVSSSISSMGNLSIKKTGNHKEINGFVCYQWRVKDIKRNTEIAYWVVDEKFDFFESLLKLLNRTEYSLSIFRDIPNSNGYLPVLTEERTLLRNDKLRIALVDITEKDLNPDIFVIPQDYKSVRR